VTAMNLRDATLCVLLVCEGFILMGFEMLASRFMNPYFGSSIETWACIISVVLCSMAFGYFSGGYLSRSDRAGLYLLVITLVSGVYLFGVSFLSGGVLLWVITNFEVDFVSTFSAAMAILALPVFLMSFWSPMIVGILASRSTLGVSIAGYVYGLSTLGNVAGTLATAFLLVPALGSSTIAMFFGLGLFLIAALLLISGAIGNRLQ